MNRNNKKSRKIHILKNKLTLLIIFSILVLSVKYINNLIIKNVSQQKKIANFEINLNNLEDSDKKQNNSKNDDSNTEIINKKDTDIIPDSNIIYSAEKYAIPAEKVFQITNDGKRIDTNKYVFLTFDDGPSSNTTPILDILKEKGVHATFFVLGDSITKKSDSSEILKRCISEGHAIGNHSYSHNLDILYPNNSVNIDNYASEFIKTNNLLKSILGDNFDSKVIRMPGGYNSRKYYKDPNLSAFDKYMSDNSIISIDWNSLNGDAEGKDYSTNEMLNYVKTTSEGKRQIVILMHDSYGKEKTVEILPDVIDYYKNNGYEFKVIKS